ELLDVLQERGKARGNFGDEQRVGSAVGGDGAARDARGGTAGSACGRRRRSTRGRAARAVAGKKPADGGDQRTRTHVVDVDHLRGERLARLLFKNVLVAVDRDDA